MENFDLLIYIGLTAFLAWRLWSVLGQRHDDDPASPPRANPFTPQEPAPDEEDVVVLEGRSASAVASGLTPAGYAPTSLAGALERVRLADPLFDERKFLDGARAAFTQIVGAFAAGDLAPVAWLLGPSVRAPFEAALKARQDAGQTLENRIERIAAADIVSAHLDGSVATLTVEFVSHQMNLLRGSDGAVIEGTPGRAEEVRDSWVFRRDVSASDPNWQLVETRS